MKEFQLQNINHLALVCKDVATTVDFYSNTLGLSLLKVMEMPNDGKHFFFDIGNGGTLAFFWFPNAPKAAPGIASMSPDAHLTGNIATAHASMNHVAFNVPLEKLEQYRENLIAKGIQATPISNADFISSFYFFDPNGILLEFAANKRPLGDPILDLGTNLL
ncbi:VOC family protein [Nostoc punctiforme FACHB-252]|uniref:VOC family protein n=1 Tax=Nostoc punctiforme FACHB-252 TaxID=1357509 RepID=A0ABR8HJP3_NOSPU|nr:VOC family protein [Nostoc punctiforme]MBD2616068.1 VOC family protein [Nostoc punctiforme FACHB-252]